MDFTLRQLEYFRAVALQGSVSAAATSERVSRSALAAAIADLEGSLRRKLFVRQKAKGMALTPYGRQLLVLSMDVLESAGRIAASAHGEEPSGRLGIGVPGSLAPTVLPAVFDHFRTEYPDVTLVPRIASTPELESLLRFGEIELAVFYGLSDQPDLEAQRLFDERLHVILPAAHPLAVSPRVRAMDLRPESFVQLEASPSLESVRAYFATQGFLPRARFRIPDYEVVRSLVGRGAGYSLVLQHQASALSYEGRGVVARPLDPAPAPVPVSCVWLAEHDLTPAAREARAVLCALAHRRASDDDGGEGG